jgi:hypothetical protein
MLCIFALVCHCILLLIFFFMLHREMTDNECRREFLRFSERHNYQTTYGENYGYNERTKRYHRTHSLLAASDPKFAPTVESKT